MERAKARPIGVTIIAILAIIDGIVLLTGGILAVTIVPMLSSGLNGGLSNGQCRPKKREQEFGSHIFPLTVCVNCGITRP